ERHGRNGLHATQHIDLIGSAKVHGCNNGGMRTTLVRRGAGDDAPYAPNPRGDDRHVPGGNPGIASARHPATDFVHGDVPVTEDHAPEPPPPPTPHPLPPPF